MSLLTISEFGDLNVKLHLSEENITKDIFLSLNSEYDTLGRSFLLVFNLDPFLYSFYSNDVEIQKSQSILSINPNTLNDYIIECRKKKDLIGQKVKFMIGNKMTEFTIRYKSPKDITRIFSLYFNQSEITIEQKGDIYEIASPKPKLINVRTQTTPPQILNFPVTDNTTIRDIIFLANYRYNIQCNEFFINETHFSCDELIEETGYKSSSKMILKYVKRTVFYKLKSKVYQTDLIGSPIGRNIKRAIALNLKVSFDDFQNYYLYNKNGLNEHFPLYKLASLTNIDSRNPIRISKKSELNIEFIRNGKKETVVYYVSQKDSLQKLRKKIQNNLDIASPSFIHFMDSKNNEVTDFSQSISKAKKDEILKVKIDDPTDINVLFQLYDNPDASLTIPISPTETTIDVQHKVAESFHIDFKHIHFWISYFGFKRKYNFLRFIYSPQQVIKIADSLTVSLTYHSHKLVISFPINLTFDELYSYCANNYNIDTAKTGIFINDPKDSNKKIAAFCTWDNSPYADYVAWFRDQENHVQLYILDKPPSIGETINDEEKTYTGESQPHTYKLEVHKPQGCVFETVELLTSQTLSSLYELNGINADTNNIDTDSLFFVNKQNYPDTTFIGDISFPDGNNVICIISPDLYAYYSSTFKTETEMKIVKQTNEMTIMEFREAIATQFNKAETFINIFYHDFQITNLWQPIKLFDPKDPFRIEILDKIIYKLKFNIEGGNIEDVPISAKSKCLDLKKYCLDTINKSMHKKDPKKKDITMQEIRVTIDSIILSKDIEKENLIGTFGQKATGEVILLEKFYFGYCDNLNGFNLSPKDTIRYAKKVYVNTILQETEIDNYKVLFNDFMTNENYPLSYYNSDDNFYEIKPNEELRAIQLYLPEILVENLIFSSSLIVYSLKEYIAKTYYNTEELNFELINKDTQEILDDNDLFDDIFNVELKFNEGEELSLTEEGKRQIQEENTKFLSPSIEEIGDGFFLCPFINGEDNQTFDLKLETNTTYETAKLRISKYLNDLEDDDYEPGNIMISINNNEIQSTKPLSEILAALKQNDPNIRFKVSILNTGDDIYQNPANTRELGISQFFTFKHPT